MQLFDRQVIELPLEDGRNSQLIFWPSWLSREQADTTLKIAVEAIAWRSDSIRIAGKTIAVPRLHEWYGEARSTYKWSGLEMRAHEFPDWLDEIREQIESEAGERFNRCLANYYRNGADSVDWHADDELELGPEPVIASLSLGAERVFNLRHRRTRQRLDLMLPHGSLLVMGKGMQACWQHRIPKVRGLDNPRVNFTFRDIR